MTNIQRDLAVLRVERDSLIQLVSSDAGTDAADIQLLKAREWLQKRADTVTTALRDSAFQIVIWPDGWRAQQYNRSVSGSAAPRDSAKAKMLADSLAVALRTSGVWSQWAEGGTYFSLHERWFLDAAGPYMTDAAREYMALRIEEQERPVAGDGSILISWPALAERLASSDKLAAENPQASFVKELMGLRNRYLILFLAGSDNTPIFSRRDGNLEPEVRKSLEAFVQENPEVPAATDVREFWNLLRDNDFRRTPAVLSHMRKLWEH